MAGSFPAIFMIALISILNSITTEDEKFLSFGEVAKIQRIFDGVVSYNNLLNKIYE